MRRWFVVGREEKVGEDDDGGYDGDDEPDASETVTRDAGSFLRVRGHERVTLTRRGDAQLSFASPLHF